MTLAIAILGVVATAIAAVAAVGSWLAAKKANAAAQAMTAIEAARRHEELQPQITIECRRQPGQADRALLYLTLKGPPALDRLDEVTLRILDEQWKDRSGQPLAGGPTPEEISQTIWGPYRFVPRVDNTKDENGRTAGAGPLELQGARNWLLQSVEASSPPRWVQDPSWWRQQYVGQPIRLLVSCWRAGQEPWALLLDVPVEDVSPRA